MPSQPETIGRYQVLGEVGRGGMGCVYRARDPVLERVVAIKTMAVDLQAEPGTRARFLREARSAARLQHPNIVTVYEFGEHEGAPFIAMELLEGETLAEALRGGRLADLGRRLDVIQQLCDGLAYAHASGVIHRDVKPNNVTILPSGTVKIVDFGVAWLEGSAATTRTGQLLGTPQYMAPEQFLGEPIDHRVDQWAVGVILWEVLAGRRPFDAPTVPSLIYQVVHQPLPPAPADVPPGLLAVAAKALSKRPGDRYGNLEEMRAALAAAREDLPTSPSLSQLRPAPLVSPRSGGTGGSATAAGRQEARAVPTPSPVRPALATPSASPVEFLPAGSFGEARRVHKVVLSPDDTVLAAGGLDGAIHLWDVASRLRVATLRNREHLRTGHGSLTGALAFSEDGAWLAAGHLDGAVYLWDVAAGLELDVRLRHDGAVTGVAFVPGGQTLITAGADATVRFYELPALLRRDARRVLRRQPDAATCLALGKAGRVVITGHAKGALRVHDTADCRLVATLHGHRAPVAAVSARGSLVASGGRDGAVRIHDVDTRELVGVHQEHARAVTEVLILPGGLKVASVAGEDSVVLWNYRHPDAPVVLPGAPGEPFVALAVTSDGRLMVGATAGGRFHLFSAALQP